MTDPDAAPLTRGDIQHRASRGALWTGLQAVVSLPLNIVATAIAARVLHAGGYGELAYLLVVFAVVLQLTDFGYTASAVQWGSEARVRGDDTALQRQLSKVTAFHVFVQGPLALIVSIVVLHAYGIAYGLAYGVTTFFFLYVSCGSLALVLDQRNDVLAQIALVANIVTQTAVIVVAVLTRDAVAVLLARGIATILPGLAALSLTRAPLRAAALATRSLRGSPREYWRFGLYSWAAACIALLVYSRSEIILLRTLSSAAQTGFFALAFGVSQQLTGPVDALVAPLVPATASLMAGHREHVARAVRRALSLSSLLAGILLAAALPVVYALFPALYGGGFDGARGLLLALGVISTFQTATSILVLLVQAQRKGRSLLLANGLALIFDLGLALALIPFFGAWGAMIANGCGQLVAVGSLTWAAVSGPTGVSIRATARGLRPWVGALPALAAAILVARLAQTPLTALGAAAAAGTSGLGVYVLTLRLFRAGPQLDDVSALSASLPRYLRRPVGTALAMVAVT
jgi:O-antigen/teichoic acid export membrane protein